MKKTILLAVACAGLVAPVLADDTNVLSDEKSRVSYAIGLRIGGSMKQNGVEVDTAVLLRGLNDGLSGTTPLMSQPQVMATMTQFQKTMQAKQMAMRAEQANKGKAEGEAFLATNKNNPGVITLPSGLQYKIVTTGDGPTPTASSMVTVNYRGTFMNGQEFDSSAKTGKPATFPVGGVIKGWTEALQLMKVGSKWQLFIPSDLAYGPQGRPGIPPNSALIFDIELLDSQAPKPPAPPVQPAPLTSDIIKVPSAEELKNGAKIEVIKPEDVQKAQAQAQAQGATNTPPQ